MNPGLISSIISGVSNLFPAIQGLFAHGFKGFKKAWQSVGDATTGAHLTGAQQEANEFESQQAERQMAFQQQMRDSQYQSAVNDMKQAGLNPAVMYGNGASGNSAPSGAMAASESPGSPDIVGLLGQMQQLRLLGAEVRLKKAQANELETRSNVNEQTAKNMIIQGDELSEKVKSLKLDNSSKEICLEFLRQEKEIGLQNLSLQGDVLASTDAKYRKEIEKLDAETQNEIQRWYNLRQELKLAIQQESVNEALIANYRALTDKLISEKNLNEEELKWYAWNHMKQVTTMGNTSWIDTNGILINHGSALKYGRNTKRKK